MKWFWTSYIPFFTSPLGTRFCHQKNILYHVQNQSYNFMPSSCPWSPTAPRPCSWPPINLRFLKLVSNDSPHPKTLIWYQNYVSSTIQNQSYNFTPWGRSGPSTDPTPCSWSSNRSETPENGLQWLPLPTNIQFDTEIVSQARSEPMSKKSKYLSLIVRFTGLPLKIRQACATSKTYSICIIFGM